MKLLFRAHRRLNKASLLKQSFGQLWDYNRPGWARRFFNNWKDALKWQRLGPFRKFAAMVEAHWDGIETYTIAERVLPGRGNNTRCASWMMSSPLVVGWPLKERTDDLRSFLSGLRPL